MAFSKDEKRFLARLTRQRLKLLRKTEGRGAATELPRVLAGEERFEHFVGEILRKLEGRPKRKRCGRRQRK